MSFARLRRGLISIWVEMKRGAPFPVRPAVRAVTEFFSRECDFTKEKSFWRGELKIVCVRSMTRLNRYFEPRVRLLTRDGVLSIELKDPLVGHLVHSALFKESRFKRGAFFDFVDRTWSAFLRKLRLFEWMEANRLTGLEIYLRSSREDPAPLFFEKLQPVKEIDYYKYRKLRRVLELKAAVGRTEDG